MITAAASSSPVSGTVTGRAANRPTKTGGPLLTLQAVEGGNSIGDIVSHRLTMNDLQAMDTAGVVADASSVKLFNGVPTIRNRGWRNQPTASP